MGFMGSSKKKSGVNIAKPVSYEPRYHLAGHVGADQADEISKQFRSSMKRNASAPALHKSGSQSLNSSQQFAPQQQYYSDYQQQQYQPQSQTPVHDAPQQYFSQQSPWQSNTQSQHSSFSKSMKRFNSEASLNPLLPRELRADEIAASQVQPEPVAAVGPGGEPNKVLRQSDSVGLLPVIVTAGIMRHLRGREQRREKGIVWESGVAAALQQRDRLGVDHDENARMVPLDGDQSKVAKTNKHTEFPTTKEILKCKRLGSMGFPMAITAPFNSHVSPPALSTSASKASLERVSISRGSYDGEHESKTPSGSQSPNGKSALLAAYLQGKELREKNLWIHNHHQQIFYDYDQEAVEEEKKQKITTNKTHYVPYEIEPSDVGSASRERRLNHSKSAVRVHLTDSYGSEEKDGEVHLKFDGVTTNQANFNTYANDAFQRSPSRRSHTPRFFVRDDRDFVSVSHAVHHPLQDAVAVDPTPLTASSSSSNLVQPPSELRNDTRWTSVPIPYGVASAQSHTLM